MAPQRRSQGPRPRVSTSPRTSLRKRAPTARIAASVVASRGKDRGRGSDQAGGEAPTPTNDLVGDIGGEATPTPQLPIMQARHIGPTSKIYQRKDKKHQVKNRRIDKTKSYAQTYDPRGAVAKEGIFGIVARGAAGDAARKREYEAT